MQMRLLVSVLSLVFIAPYACVSIDSVKGLKVALNARWAPAPLLHEAAEFVADESPELFWKFSQSWQPRDENKCWQSITGHTADTLQLKSAVTTQLLKMSLAARYYSPRLETFRQLSEQHEVESDCCSVVIGDESRKTSKVSEIENLIKEGLQENSSPSARLQIHPFDHVYPSGFDTQNSNDTLPVILYAPIASPCTQSMDEALRKIASSDRRLSYVWRPVACSSSPLPCANFGTETTSLPLHGYGVELAIKNMEYNARDDAKVQEIEQEGDGNNEPITLTETELLDSFQFPSLLEKKPSLKAATIKLYQKLARASIADVQPAGISFGDLGIQATSRISSAADPLHMLTEISQNFPLRIESLNNELVGIEVEDAVDELQSRLQPGVELLLVNGVPYQTQDFNLYAFLDKLRNEVRMMEQLLGAGLSPEAAHAVAALRGIPRRGSSAPRLDVRPDAALGEVTYVTDIEKDEEYARLHPRLMAMLQPAFFGGPPSVRRNVFTALLLFDPATWEGLSAGNTALEFVKQGWAVRIGLMPIQINSDPSSNNSIVARMFAATAAIHGGRTAAMFLDSCYQKLYNGDRAPEIGEGVSLADIALPVASYVFIENWAAWSDAGVSGGLPDVDESVKDPQVVIKHIIDNTGAISDAANSILSASTKLAERKGLVRDFSPVMLFNGRVTALNEDEGKHEKPWFARINNAWHDEIQSVVNQVYMGRIKDSSTDIYADILANHKSAPRYNPRILAMEKNDEGRMRWQEQTEKPETRNVVLAGNVFSDLPVYYFATVARDHDAEENKEEDIVDEEYVQIEADYTENKPLNKQSKVGIQTITHWVVVNARSPTGWRLAADALKHSSPSSRIGLLINVDDKWDELTAVEQMAIALASGLVNNGKLSSESVAAFFKHVENIEEDIDTLDLNRMTYLLPESINPIVDVQTGKRALNETMLVEPVLANLTAAAESHARFIRKVLGLTPEVNAVVTNGRIVEARFLGDIALEDFELMDVNAALNQRAGNELLNALREEEGMDESKRLQLSNAAIAASSILSSLPAEDVFINTKAIGNLFRSMDGNPLILSERHADSPLRIKAIMDPLSKTTQQLSAVLSAMRASMDIDMEVLLHPSVGYTEAPLKTFYRYLVPDVGGDNGGLAAEAVFSLLPLKKTLTLGMDVPESWLVQPIAAVQDLDNLRLEELPKTERYATAQFELEALLVSGSCLDATAMARQQWDAVHPRGVQLQLGVGGFPIVDTLVMSNLGYFQLKAAPGVWDLRLAPGRSQELYTMKTSASLPNIHNGAAQVAVTSFVDDNVVLIIEKDHNRVEEDVLDPEGSSAEPPAADVPSVWNKFKSLVHLQRGNTAGDSDPNTIHVFTVASGHMYERLQKIMILSAIKRTSARVKFWFIENYMSPAMKEFVPLMAEVYGFDYEFVTYKWPSWLHKQTEKQRIIWAYKILFLDVLFPLNLKKVIFCDSDQVIRADLKELWEMDLEGAPYGYTPFCDTNTDMEGFRFWKQGFWRDHLMGKPYHISALYVVDLERFRQIAAGDRLRVFYSTLSKDPHSLSNLDQDLPNYAQHQVPIKSLPQEWLWCETWCGEASRPAAKTIDLCNNPLTKEPKLQSARRIIAEWPDLNREVQELTERVEGVLAGKATMAELKKDQSRFVTVLEPMVEGSIRCTGGECSKKIAQVEEDSIQEGVGEDDDEAGAHDEL